MNNLIKKQRRNKKLRAMAAQYRMQIKWGTATNNGPLLPLRYAVAARILELHPEAINLTWGEAADAGFTKI